jgi:putative transcriptional regulator
MPDTSGIYTITNTITGKQYIGRSVGINGRWAAHRALLDRGEHVNKVLQADWQHYGAGAFTFDVLEVIATADVSVLAAAEARHLEAASGELYNVAPVYIPGRPHRHEPGEQSVTIRLSKEDRAAAEKLAKKDKRSLSNWLRMKVVNSHLKAVVALREIRERRSFTIRQIAAESGASRTTVQRLLNNTMKRVPLDDLGRLCSYFDCGVSDILKEEEVRSV